MLMVFGGEMYDLLLFDFGLLKCDGIDVLCMLCGCGFVLLVLIVIVCDVVVDCVKGFDVGVDDYFVKLFDFDELGVWMCVLICC